MTCVLNMLYDKREQYLIPYTCGREDYASVFSVRGLQSNVAIRVHQVRGRIFLNPYILIWITMGDSAVYGYVVVNKPELKIKEYDVYRSYYCGLCDELKERYGVNGQLSISYDMTFLMLLLTGLYEPDTRKYEARCIAHPVHKHPVSRNDISGYVADMNVLMTYYKCMDDWNDDRKVTRKALADSLKGKVRRIEAEYKDKAAAIRTAMDKLGELEKAGESNVDMPAEQFGIIMSQILLMKDDEWKDTLVKIGSSLGRFIYILDAYEDLDEDNKKGRYNALRAYADRPDYDIFVENVLKSLMAQCAAGFERLPIIENVNLLRNIIYSGVWTRFELCKNKKDGVDQR